MPTYRLDIEYDGSAFHGWQTQPGLTTVQATIEAALTVALRCPTPIVGSGRTDAGVHARGQVAHFVSAAPVDSHRLQGSLNGLLPAGIAILNVEAAPEGFHARYGATRRLYHYHVATQPRALDQSTRVFLRPTPAFERMNEAACHLIGQHDFNTFCRTKSDTQNRVCTIDRAVWLREEREGDWRFEIAANRFLHGMVRAIVGTLLDVGRGKRTVDSIPGLLAAKDRRAAGPAAPARGLVLHYVTYPGSGPADER
ncbi:MAG: tRNA pseudouridine(38-40) synthase TruA [Bacteroidota bacterium]